MPELVKFVRDASWIALASLTFSVVMLWLIVVGNGRPRAERAEAHAEELLAGVVREGHGGMTMFLWVSFTLRSSGRCITSWSTRSSSWSFSLRTDEQEEDAMNGRSFRNVHGSREGGDGCPGVHCGNGDCFLRHFGGQA